MICFNSKEAIWSLTRKKTRKQERKANRTITLDGKNSKKVELQGHQTTIFGKYLFGRRFEI